MAELRRGRVSDYSALHLRQSLQGSPQPRITAKEIATIEAAARRLPGARVDGHPLVTAIHWDGEERAPAFIQHSQRWVIALDDADCIIGATLAEVLRGLALPRPTIGEADLRKAEAAFARAASATIFHDARQITVCASLDDEAFEAAFTQRPKGWVLRMDSKWHPGKLEALLARAWDRYAKLAKHVTRSAPPLAAPSDAEDAEDAEEVEAEPIDAELQAEIDDLPALRSWDVLRKPGRRGKRLVFLNDEGAPQARALAYLRAHEEPLRDRLAALLLEAHASGIGGRGDGYDGDEPDVEGIANLHRAFDVASVRVTVTAQRGVAFVAVRILTGWVKKVGLGVLLHEGAIVSFDVGEPTETDALAAAQRAEGGLPPVDRRWPVKTATLPSWKRMLAKHADRPLVSAHLGAGSRRPNEWQRAAVELLGTHDAAIKDKLLAAILDEYWAWTWREKQEDEARLASYRLPAVNDAHELARVVRLERVIVSPVQCGPLAYTGFVFECAWLPWSGLAVLVLGDKVIDLGDLSTISPEAAQRANEMSAAEARRFKKQRVCARDPWWAERPAPLGR